MRFGLSPIAAARFSVLNIAYSKSEVAGSVVRSASAASTSPFGRTQIHRGCLRPVAKALTLSPGATVGAFPAASLCAVGILSVGRLPCGLAAGMAGLAPKACVTFRPSCPRNDNRRRADPFDHAREYIHQSHRWCPSNIAPIFVQAV